MGYWNETCFMSNLPICYGDKVALFVLAPASRQVLGEAYYPSDNFVALGFPIIGTYDDYGGIEKVSINPYMERYLASFKMFRKQTGTSGEDEYVDYHYKSVKEFLDALTSNQLFVNTALPVKKSSMSYVMIHYELYQSLLMDMANRKPYGDSQTLKELHRVGIVQALKQMYDEVQDFGSNLGFTAFNLSDYYHYSQDNRWKSMDKMAKYYLEFCSDDELIDEIVDFILWHMVMLYSRKGYHCYSGAGSQSAEYKIHKLIATFILEKCEERQNGSSDDSLEEAIFF